MAGEPTTATITLLFCDLVESTALASRLGDIAADDVRHACFDRLRGAITGHRGTEVKHLGDGLMASFGSNADAVGAAVAMCQQVDALGRERELPLSLRVGISVGEATFEDDDWFGTPVIEAARLCDAAQAGQILVADVVRLLLGTRAEQPMRSVGELQLKGLPEPMSACEIDWEPVQHRTLSLQLPRAFSIAPRFALAGRSEELEDVLAAWKQAQEGPRRAVLLAGEPGIGKTRLAAEVGRRADADDGSVLLGRCDEGLGVPYQPFVEALAHVTAHAPEDRLPELLGPTAGELTRILPELSARISGLKPTTSEDSETERYLLFEAVTGWLECHSRVAPVLLVLDDIHWAAEPTLLMLRHVLRSGRDMRLLIVATYRDTEVDRTHALGSLLADLRRTDGVDRIALRGLDHDGVAELVEKAAGHDLHDDARALASALHAETGGNPFFATEVLVHLAERGAIIQGADGLWRTEVAIEDLGIPEGVKEVVGRRLATLPSDCDAVLHAAAVIGQEFELDLLGSVAGIDGDQVIDALEASRAAGLLDELGGSTIRYRFAHALVQQTLLDEVPTARRLRLHRAAAEAIEIHRAHALDRYRTALARHWYEAGTEPTRALAACMAAGDQALAHFADQEALNHLRRARELLPDADADADLAIDVLIATGEAMRRVGDPEHREVLLQAGAQAKAVGDGPRMARAALANGRGWQSHAGYTDNERVEALRDAIAALGEDDSPMRAMLLARFAVESLYGPERNDRFGFADEALAVARRVGDDHTIATVISSRHNVFLSPDSIEQRLAEGAELGRLAKRLGDPSLEWWAGVYAHFPNLQAGRIGEARRALADTRVIAERSGRPEWVWPTTWQRAAFARLDGDLDAFEELSSQALEIGSEAGIPDAAQFYAYQWMVLCVDRARLDDRDRLRDFVELIPPMYGAGKIFASYHALVVGARSEIRDELDAAVNSPHVPWGSDPGAIDSALTWAFNMGAVAAAVGDERAADAAYRYMRQYPRQLAGNTIWLGPTETYLAGCAPLAGDPDALDGHLEHALETCESIPAPINLMYALVIGACGLAWRDRPGDRDRVRSLLDRAIEIGDRTGAGFARAAAENLEVLAH